MTYYRYNTAINQWTTREQTKKVHSQNFHKVQLIHFVYYLVSLVSIGSDNHFVVVQGFSNKWGLENYKILSLGSTLLTHISSTTFSLLFEIPRKMWHVTCVTHKNVIFCLFSKQVQKSVNLEKTK